MVRVAPAPDDAPASPNAKAAGAELLSQTARDGAKRTLPPLASEANGNGSPLRRRSRVEEDGRAEKDVERGDGGDASPKGSVSRNGSGSESSVGGDVSKEGGEGEAVDYKHNAIAVGKGQGSGELSGAPKDIFISYCRVDQDIVRRIYDRLREHFRNPWVDWVDIPLVSDWLDTIHKGIEGADVFMFMLSPDSVKSEVCRKEIDHAVSLGKKLVPVVIRDVDPKTVPESLAAINWLFMREEKEPLVATFPRLLHAIDVDLEHVREHTRLTVRALEWDAAKRDKSLVLYGNELGRAQMWLEVAETKPPHPTPLIREFLKAGQRLRRRKTLLRFMLAIAIVAGCIGFAIGSLMQSKEAQDLRRQAEKDKYNALLLSAWAQHESGVSSARQYVSASQQQLASGRSGIGYFHLVQGLTAAIASGEWEVMAEIATLAENLLAFALDYPTTYVWKSLNGMRSYSRSVDFDVGGPYVLSGGFDDHLGLWNFQTDDFAPISLRSAINNAHMFSFVVIFVTNAHTWGMVFAQISRTKALSASYHGPVWYGFDTSKAFTTGATPLVKLCDSSDHSAAYVQVSRATHALALIGCPDGDFRLYNMSNLAVSRTSAIVPVPVPQDMHATSTLLNTDVVAAFAEAVNPSSTADAAEGHCVAFSVAQFTHTSAKAGLLYAPALVLRSDRPTEPIRLARTSATPLSAVSAISFVHNGFASMPGVLLLVGYVDSTIDVFNVTALCAPARFHKVDYELFRLPGVANLTLVSFGTANFTDVSTQVPNIPSSTAGSIVKMCAPDGTDFIYVGATHFSGYAMVSLSPGRVLNLTLPAVAFFSGSHVVVSHNCLCSVSEDLQKQEFTVLDPQRLRTVRLRFPTPPIATSAFLLVGGGRTIVAVTGDVTSVWNLDDDSRATSGNNAMDFRLSSFFTTDHDYVVSDADSTRSGTVVALAGNFNEVRLMHVVPSSQFPYPFALVTPNNGSDHTLRYGVNDVDSTPSVGIVIAAGDNGTVFTWPSIVDVINGIIDDPRAFVAYNDSSAGDFFAVNFADHYRTAFVAGRRKSVSFDVPSCWTCAGAETLGGAPRELVYATYGLPSAWIAATTGNLPVSAVFSHLPTTGGLAWTHTHVNSTAVRLTVANINASHCPLSSDDGDDPGLGTAAGIAVSPDGRYIAVTTSTYTSFVFANTALVDTGSSVPPSAAMALVEPACRPLLSSIVTCPFYADAGLRMCKIAAVAFSPDSTLLAVGNPDGTVGVWALYANARFDGGVQPFAFAAVLPASQSLVTSLMFSNAGDLLAVGEETGAVRVFSGMRRVRAGGFIDGTSSWPFSVRHFESQTRRVFQLHFNADDSLLFSAADDNDVCAYNMTTTCGTGAAVVVTSLSSMTKGVADGGLASLTISSDGKYLFAGVSEGGVKLFTTDLRILSDLATLKSLDPFGLPFIGKNTDLRCVSRPATV